MRIKWSDQDVLYWAVRYIIVPDCTLIDLEAKLGVCHSTMWWCFMHRLEALDPELYTRVYNKLKRDHENYVYKK